jgi:predicted XRE-type DNA-binding protein
MKKTKAVVAWNVGELTALGSTPADGAKIELQSDLNTKIAEVVARKGLTHLKVAKLAGTSRTRVTAILNRNTKDISTDLMLRVLYALGYTAKVRFKRAAGDVLQKGVW